MAQQVTIIIKATNKQRALNYINALPTPLKSESIEYTIEKIEEEKQLGSDKHKKEVKHV